MKRLTLALLLVAAGAPAVSRAQAPARPAHDLASLLPARTLALFQCEDLGGFERWTKETALGRIWAEPEMQRFLKGLDRSVNRALESFTGGMDPLATIGLELDDLRGIAIRNAGLALVDLDFTQGPRVDAVLALQFREGGDKAKKIADALREALGMYTGLVFEQTEVGGRAMHHLAVPNHDIHLLADAAHVVLTTQRERMEQLLAAASGTAPAEGSLRDSPAFAKAMQRMGADRTAVLGFANVKRLHARLTAAWARAEGPARVARFQHYWSTLGFDAMEAIAFADIPRGTGFRSELAITLEERRGLFRLVPTGRPSHRFARFAPHDCLIYGGEVFDPKKFADDTIELIGSVEPRAAQRVLEAEREINTNLGFRVREDLAASLGTEWAWYLGSPPAGGLIPDFVILATVRDRARLERSLDLLVERLVPLAERERVHLVSRTMEFRGVKVRVLEMSEGRDDPVPLAPSWAFVDDFVVFAPYPQALKHALMDKRPLAENEDFRSLLRAVPETAVSSSYLDLKGLSGWLYNGLVPVLQVMQGAINRATADWGLQLAFHDLPPAEVITRHLGGAMFYTSNEPDCLRMGFVSPCGMSLMAIPLAAGLAAGLVAYSVERDQRREFRRARRAAEARVETERLRAEVARERARNQQLRARMADIERQIEELRALLEEERNR